MFKPQTAFAGFLLLLALLSQGCGRKGPLYMPQEPAKPVPTLQTLPVQPAVTNQIDPNQTMPSQMMPGQILPSQTEPEKFP